MNIDKLRYVVDRLMKKGNFDLETIVNDLDVSI